jgi:serine/threonine protein kinase
MVYAATHELTGRRVALKLMLNDCDDSPILQERFLSEARIAAAVRHPNIVDVLDMGLHGGSPFIVMELLEGVSLESVLEQQTRLSIEQALAWLLPIVGSLSVLHEAGIVHRDVKPSNIFLSALPRHPMRPKLLDFGLARVVSDLRLTRSGTVIGTPLYMAPEHAAGQVTGPQADVWSIGVVLYESISGCSPFNYTDRASLAMQVIAGLVRPLDQVRPNTPPLFSAALGRALHRDLSRRYPDMRAFAQALHAAAVASGIPVPLDPDPIGLPEYAQWQRGGIHATTTMEQFAYSDPVNHGSNGAIASRARGSTGAGSARGSSGSGAPPGAGATRGVSGSGSSTPVSESAPFGSSSASVAPPQRSSGRTRLVWFGLVAVLVAVSSAVAWSRAREPDAIEPLGQRAADVAATHGSAGSLRPGEPPALPTVPATDKPVPEPRPTGPTVHSLANGAATGQATQGGATETVIEQGATKGAGARTPASNTHGAPGRRREREPRAAERPAEAERTPSRHSGARVSEPADEVESEWK